MVNQQPEGFGEQQWFPQLPEGYTAQNNHMQEFPRHQQGQNFPGYGMPGFSPSHGSPGHRPPGHGGFPGHQSPGHGMPGFPPGQGGFPGHRPPGHGGFPGHQSPGHGMPGFPPGQGQQGQQAPTSPPPNFAPTYPSHQLFAVDPGAIRGCLYRFTYVWLSRRQGFWFFPTFVGRTSVAGYRWRSRQRRWEYFGIDLNNIDRFSCS